MTFSADQLRVAGNVLAIARKYQQVTGVPPLAHLAVTYQESNWSEDAVNQSDPDGSYGPYQQNGAAWSPSAIVGPDPWFDYGFARLRDAWTQAWAAHGQGWETPSLRSSVLQNFAPAAQGSIGWTVQQADDAYAAALAALELLS